MSKIVFSSSVAIERVLDSAAAILRAIDSIQVAPALFVKSLHLMTLFLDRSAYLPFLSVWDPDALASLIIHCFDGRQAVVLWQ